MKKNSKILLYYIEASLSILLFSLPLHATPVIGIGSMYDVLTPDNQSMTKRIYNTGDSTAFVRVELLEIDIENKINIETKQNEISGKTLERNRLIVTPQRLIIPPDGFQSVRVIWPGERTHERYFRIRFTPVMPESNDSFGLNKSAVDEYRNNNLHAGLNVLTGYGSIMIIQPDQPIFKTEIREVTADKILVRNNGNATISLDDIRYCKLANTDCGTTSREFIFPGRTHTLKKELGYKTNFTLIEGNTKRSLSF